MSGLRYEVPALSRASIRGVAQQVRVSLDLKCGAFPIIRVLELAMPIMFPGFEFSVGSKADMGSDHGRTIPAAQQVVLREDVYYGALDGKGRDRLTAAHELGHYLLHQNISVKLARSDSMPPAYRDSEWQANCFAGELLMPSYELARCRSIDEICKRFGVSRDAANQQNAALSKEGLMRRDALMAGA